MVDICYVLTVVSVNHATHYVPDCQVVGVYTSKAAAAAAAGGIRTDYGTFDDAINGDMFDYTVDSRDSPPDHGCLLQIGSPESGEGDFTKLEIQQFPLKGFPSSSKEKVASSNSKRKAKSSPPLERKAIPKSKTARSKSVSPTTRPLQLVQSDTKLVKKHCKHLSNYRQTCKSVQEIEKDVEEEAKELRSCKNPMVITCARLEDEKSENTFEAQAGNFWGQFHTRDYMRARVALADKVYELASKEESPELWTNVLLHYQEMMRLNASDNLGLRYRFPFLLLCLNRDDDAFSFCRYWINAEGDQSNDEERRKNHSDSKEGDWIYPSEEGCRRMDIFDECRRVNIKDIDVAFLVAIAIVKLRLVESLTEEPSRSLVGYQREIERLLDEISKQNPTMLPAILNPEPLMSQPLPEYRCRGAPDEAYWVLRDARTLWMKVPGAKEMLIKRFGPKPKYNHKL